MIEVLDTYYNFIRTQMSAVSAPQRFGGLISARDWPQSPPIEGALYLLYLTANPLNGPVSSQAQTRFEYFCQWSWYLIGTDIPPNQQAQNRGNRYRDNFGIIQNLRQASFPGFAQKKSFTVSNQTTGTLTQTPVESAYPVSHIEMIHWTMPRFMPKQDEKSGLIYGAAAVSVFAWDDIMASLAEAS